MRTTTALTALLAALPALAFSQSAPPVCHDGAPTWEGLCIRSEPVGRRVGYVRTSHADSEAALIRDLPANLLETSGDRITAFRTPYLCKRFAVNAQGKATTDIDHIVALAEAHDSGLAPSQRHAFANDLDNQVVADRTVNRTRKGDRDAAGWTPDRNGRWFAERVIRVKQRYGLSIDSAEAEALKTLLDDGSGDLSCS